MTNTRLAFRRLAKTPGYAIAAVTTLAMAIGANSAVFSAVHAVLLGQTGVRRPEEILILLVGVVALASYLPARRAADIDPIALLRRE